MPGSRVRVPPFPPKFSRFFSGLALKPGWLLPNLLPNRLSTGKSSRETSARHACARLPGREAASPAVADFGLWVSGRSPAVFCRVPFSSDQFIASRIGLMSASMAPSVQAAYTDGIVVGRWPCSFATNRGLRPTVRFQLTDVCRAVYGLR